MKLKAHFYEMIVEVASLLMKLLIVMRSQTIGSILSMVHIKHQVFASLAIAKLIQEHYNLFLPAEQHIRIEELIEIHN